MNKIPVPCIIEGFQTDSDRLQFLDWFNKNILFIGEGFGTGYFDRYMADGGFIMLWCGNSGGMTYGPLKHIIDRPGEYGKIARVKFYDLISGISGTTVPQKQIPVDIASMNITELREYLEKISGINRPA